MSDRRITEVEAVPGSFALRLVWKDGTRDDVDLTGLVHRSRHFRRFLDHPQEFDRVAPVNWGHGIAWENGLDYSAENLDALAREQRPMTSAEFRAVQERLDLTNQEAADVLGVHLNTVKNYRAGRGIPEVTANAWRRLEENPTAFYANFRPRKVGRGGGPERSAG